LSIEGASNRKTEPAAVAKQPSSADWAIEASPMKTVWSNWVASRAVIALSPTVPGFAHGPLSSRNNTAPKKAFVTFVERVTEQGSPDFAAQRALPKTAERSHVCFVDLVPCVRVDVGRSPR
jgi:hypothetical protein